MRLFSLLALVLLGSAFAQTDLPTGIPAEYQATVILLVGLIAGWLVQPLTAIWKKLGRTQGPTTVFISGVLSLVVALGFNFAQAVADGRGQNLWHVLFIALIAFLKANGDYLSRVFGTAKGTEVGTTTGPTPQSGFEDLK